MKFQILMKTMKEKLSSKLAFMVGVCVVAAVFALVLSLIYRNTNADPLTTFSVMYPIVSDYFHKKIFLSVVVTTFFCNVTPLLGKLLAQLISDVRSIMEDD